MVWPEGDAEHEAKIARTFSPRVGGPVDGMRAMLRALLADVDKWAARLGYGIANDHGCVECYPESGMLVEGFLCAYHRAAAVVRGDATPFDSLAAAVEGIGEPFIGGRPYRLTAQARRRLAAAVGEHGIAACWAALTDGAPDHPVSHPVGWLVQRLAHPPIDPDADHLAELTEACERATTTWMPAVSVHAVRWALAELERLQVERDAAVGQVRLAHEFLGALRAAPPERKAGR